jgi:hypothetical protein
MSTFPAVWVDSERRVKWIAEFPEKPHYTMGATPESQKAAWEEYHRAVWKAKHSAVEILDDDDVMDFLHSYYPAYRLSWGYKRWIEDRVHRYPLEEEFKFKLKEPERVYRQWEGLKDHYEQAIHEGAKQFELWTELLEFLEQESYSEELIIPKLMKKFTISRIGDNEDVDDDAPPTF